MELAKNRSVADLLTRVALYNNLSLSYLLYALLQYVACSRRITPIYDILIAWRFFAKRYESGRSGDCMIIERREVAVARLTVNNSKLMVMSLSIHTLQHFSLLAENRGISKYGLVSYYFI